MALLLRLKQQMEGTTMVIIQILPIHIISMILLEGVVTMLVMVQIIGKLVTHTLYKTILQLVGHMEQVGQETK